MVVINYNKEKEFGNRKVIDIWWGGLQGNGGLMILLAYLLQSSRAWWDTKVRVKMVVNDEKAAKNAQENLNNILKRVRIDAKAEVLVSGEKPFNQILQESSGDADLVFLGMAEPDEKFSTYYQNIQKRLKNLPTTVMVLAAEEISFGAVLMQEDTFHEV